MPELKPDAELALNGLKQAALADLALLGFPAAPWLAAPEGKFDEPMVDVAIIGAGSRAWQSQRT